MRSYQLRNKVVFCCCLFCFFNIVCVSSQLSAFLDQLWVITVVNLTLLVYSCLFPHLVCKFVVTLPGTHFVL